MGFIEKVKMKFMVSSEPACLPALLRQPAKLCDLAMLAGKALQAGNALIIAGRH